jgi:hypothetical protein
MPFDGVQWPLLRVLVGVGAEPGPGTIILDVGPGLGTGTLGGYTMVDLAADTNTIVIQRGRDSDIDVAAPGTCTLVLDNSSGSYDPTNPNGPYWGPNLLTANESSVETDASGWQAGQDTTIARSTAQAKHGSASLQLTKTVGTGTLFAQSATGITGRVFPPGVAVRVDAWFRAFSTGRSCRVRLAFHTLGGVYLPGRDLLSATVADSSSGWVQAQVTGVSPPEPTRVVPELQVLGGVNTEVHYADLIRIQATAIDMGVPVQVNAEWPAGVTYERFTGAIADINLDAGYSPTVTFTCADGLETLARAQLPVEQPEFDGDRTGQRIGHLADRAGWPATARALDTGYTTLGSTTLGGFALELMRKVETTEFGLLFVDAAGTLTFYDRHRPTTANRSALVQATFTDTQGATDVEMMGLAASRSRELQYNDAHITRDPNPAIGDDAPAEQVATDTTSVARYGTLSLPTQLGSLHRDDNECLAMAQYLVGRYSLPMVRIRSVQVEAITQGLWSILLPLGLLDRIATSRDYGPSTVTTQLLVQAMREEIRNDDQNAAWDFTFTTSTPEPTVTLFVLDSSQLDLGRLGW